MYVWRLILVSWPSCSFELDLISSFIIGVGWDLYLTPEVQ